MKMTSHWKAKLPIAAAGLGIITLSIFADLNRPKNTTKEDTQAAKEIVRKHNPDRYIQILEDGNDCTKAWQKAAKEVKDSLRVDSLCRKAYFEGAQMVRDSINSAKNFIK